MQALPTYSCSLLRLFLASAFVLDTKLSNLQHVPHWDKPDVVIIMETKFSSDEIVANAVLFAGYSEPLCLDRDHKNG